MKAVHLTSVHPVDDVRVFHRECRTLALAGYDVVLIAPDGGDWRPDDVRLVKVPLPAGRVQRMTRTIYGLYKAAIREKADVYHFHDPELIPLALAMKVRGKTKVIYDVHEDLPRQIHNKTWIPRWLKPLISACAEVVETLTAAAVDGIVAATPTIASRFPVAKTVIVRNYPVPEELNGSVEAPGGAYATRGNKLAYIGVVSLARGWREMASALALLPRELNATFEIAGPIEGEAVQQEIGDCVRTGTASYATWLDRSGVAELLLRCKLGLVVLHPLACYIDALPIKLFEYMAAGLPVVASNFPLWKDIVEDSGCGLTVDPLQPDQIAEAITRLLEDPAEAEKMGQRGREAVAQKYNWAREGERLKLFYRNLLEF